MYFAVVAKASRHERMTPDFGGKQTNKTSVWVYTSENHGTSIEVPVTPETTVLNILECVRDPVRGEGYLVAVVGDTDYILQEGDNAYTFLYEIWKSTGTTPNFLLRYCNQQAEWPPPELEARRHQMRHQQESSASRDKLPGYSGDMTLMELQEMASRQQQVLETQQQVLVAKEQRLKYLKQQEARHAQLASESERLRKIRERVENQELKLKKLRALRGQAEQFRINKGNLNSELEAVKSVFSEKEKELAMAVARVEQLTRQLKDLKNGINNGVPSNKQAAANLELEKLKKELLIRNKLNEQQNNMIATKEKLLNERREKVALMDARIYELQQRLKKKQLQEQQGVQNSKVSKNIIQNPAGSNLGNVEQYSGYKPPDLKSDLQKSTGGFTKQDPLSRNTPSDNRYGSPAEPVEDHLIKRQDTKFNEQVEEYKLPVVLPMDSVTDYSDNLLRKMSRFSQRPSTPDRNSRLDTAHENVHQTTNIPKLAPGQISVTKSTAAGLKFFPSSDFGQDKRLHGSFNGAGDGTSTSQPVTGLLPTSVTSSAYPIININEEERQAGSGQSSPASTESSPNSGSGAQIQGSNEQQVNTSHIGPVSAMIEKLNKNVGQVDGKMQQILSSSAGLRRSNFTQRSHGPSLDVNTAVQKSGTLQTGLSTGTSLTSGSTGTNQQTRTHLNTQGLTINLLSCQPEVDSSHLETDSPHTPSPVVSSAGTMPVTNQAPSPSSSGPHLNQKPALPYRYASKNTIANTYMGRLGSAAMERYQKNLNLLYQNVDSQGNTNVPTAHQDATSTTQMPTNDILSPEQNHAQFGAAITSPSYPDIASDKGSFKLHTPKQVRRRHSDSENEDLNKALQEQQDREQQQQQRLQQQQMGGEQYKDSRVTSVEDPMSPSNDKLKSTIDNEKTSKTTQQISDGKPPESPTKTAAVLQKNEKTESSPTKTKSPTSAKVEAVLKRTKSNLKKEGSRKSNNRVSFDPLALLLDASLEGELDLVKKVALQVDDVSTPNDEGITALHNAICAGHFDIVMVLVEFGCDVNAPDSDGWTPLHCAASCNNLPMVRFLVEHGACVFATTISDHETAADKCEEDEDGYDSCSDYLYSIQEKMGIINNGEVYAVFDYQATNTDELSFCNGSKLTVLRKGDDKEKEWWWAQLNGKEGYIPRNLLGLFPRVVPKDKEVSDC